MAANLATLPRSGGLPIKQQFYIRHSMWHASQNQHQLLKQRAALMAWHFKLLVDSNVVSCKAQGVAAWRQQLPAIASQLLYESQAWVVCGSAHLLLFQVVVARKTSKVPRSPCK